MNSRIFWGGGGGNVGLEKSRFDWLFLNVGLPKFLSLYLYISQLMIAVFNLKYNKIKEILSSDIFWSKLGYRTFLFVFLDTLYASIVKS